MDHGETTIGVIGLAVMGKSLALNIESRGYSISVYNRPSEL
ncbi:6-phosphogluconate dehydrogenase, NADP(+)-dependent, decarboxylating [Peribacillus sp. Bi96]|nr:6-phosphogluconate dehydrogenase, NADP(+)-dependent, decarboxylating [Peribacillus sp. Bi96]